jgi:hypothetical protein
MNHPARPSIGTNKMSRHETDEKIWQKNGGQKNRRLYANIDRPFFAIRFFCQISNHSNETEMKHGDRQANGDTGMRNKVRVGIGDLCTILGISQSFPNRAIARDYGPISHL